MKLPVMDRSTLLLFALVGMYLFVVTFLSEIDYFTRLFIHMKSEYTAKEQLLKFTLLIVVVMAIKCLSQERDKILLQLAMVYLIFAMTMYLAESNMIREKLQPLFAGLLMPLLLHGLFKKKAFWSAFFLLAGLGIVALGVVKDFAVEHQSAADVIPPLFLKLLMQFNEEMLDMVGIGLIGLSALTLFYSSLQKISKQGLRYSALLSLAIMLVAVGNGLSHYQYHPSTSLWFTGLFMALVGTGLFILSEYLMDDEQKLFQHCPNTNYLFLFFFLVILPSFGSKYTYFTSIMLWFTVLTISIIFHRAANTSIKMLSSTGMDIEKSLFVNTEK